MEARPDSEKRAPAPLNALILEDNDSDYEIVLHGLKRAGFEVTHKRVFDEAGYSAALDRGLDIILADFHLPQFDALSALKILRDRGFHVPFIVVTGSLSEEAAVACLKSGATDYLIKDRLARLGPAISQALEARKTIEAKFAAERQIRRRNRELTMLNRIIAASAEGQDERDILNIACEELANVLGAERTAAIILSLDRTAAQSIVHYSRKKDGEHLDEIMGLESEEMRRVEAALAAPVVINDLAASEIHRRMRDALLPKGIRSLAIFPIMINGTSEGCLAMAAGKKGFFEEEEISLSKSVADQLANSLARARLERERAMLSAAIEQATDAVVITDPDGLIRYVNPVYETITGYRPEEAIGKGAEFLCAAGLADDEDKARRADAWQGKAWRRRMECRRKDGKPFTVDSTFCPVLDKAGAVTSYVGVQRDVTESLLLEQRYLQAQKMEAVGRLAGGIAHDFNNLLTVIMGYADVLAITFSSDAEHLPEALEIKKAAESAAGLTRQLLAFSRKQVLKPRVVDVNSVVERMEGMLKPIIGSNIAIEADLDPELGPIQADPGQIEQIIMNLSVNARDAMPKGGKLRLSTRNVDADEAFARARPEIRPGPYVSLSVSDTGTGMSEEAMSHLFEPFFTTKAEGKGTGLGLSTVYGIVKQSGGFIAPTSEVGKGTRFEMMFPRLGRDAAARSGPGGGKAESPGSGRIVIAEDDATVRELTQKILAKLGYRVAVTKSAQEALDLCAEKAGGADLLVTDVLMPGIGGIELAKRVRESNPDIKVLFISGFANDASVAAAVSERNTAFLAKPFTYEELAGALRGLMEGEGDA